MSNQPSRPAAVVLAAGASSRFGRDKLAEKTKIDGITAPLIVHALRPWLEVFDHVVLVLRPEGEELRRLLTAEYGAARFHFVMCRNAAQGMSASLASGIKASKRAGGWVVGLADMPSIPTYAIRAVRNVMVGGTPLAAPFFNGQRGHPVGFGQDYYEELVDLSGDQGARSLLQRDAERIYRIEIPDQGILLDVDKPADLERLTK